MFACHTPQSSIASFLTSDVAHIVLIAVDPEVLVNASLHAVPSATQANVDTAMDVSFSIFAAVNC